MKPLYHHHISVYIKWQTGFTFNIFKVFYSNDLYIEGLERSSKYIHYKGCNAMYVEGVEKSSKYIVMGIMLCISKVSKDVQNTL